MDNVLEACWQLMKALVADNTSPLYFDGVAGTATTTPHGVRSVFKGDPNHIPDSDVPAVIVRPVHSHWVKGQSRYDQKEHIVEVLIVENAKNYRETSNVNGRIVQAMIYMMQMMEQTDANQKTLGTTIVGKLRANILLPYTDSNSVQQTAAVDLTPESIDYVFNTSRGFPTFEVIGSFRILSQGDRA